MEQYVLSDPGLLDHYIVGMDKTTYAIWDVRNCCSIRQCYPGRATVLDHYVKE